MSRMDLSIAQIAQACKGKLCLGGANLDRCVTSVVLDSRKVTMDGVFVATVGERVDGHQFISEVFAKGVGLVIAQKTIEEVCREHGLSTQGWKCYLYVEDTFQALKDIAEYYRSKLTIPIVGITGSVGKTSTKEFVATVLSQKYQVLKTEGNFNNEVGVPLTLLRIRKEHEAAVIEMGISDFGEMHRLSKMVRPNICLITNIGQCHLENLKTRDGILQAKTEIFDFMDPDGEVCLNGEDDKLCTIKEVHGKRVHFFGMSACGAGESPAEVYASHVEGKGLWGSEALLHMRHQVGQAEGIFPVQVPLPGKHMVLNAAAAACVGRLLGLDKEQITSGISKVSAVSGRTNLIRLSDYTLIDDCYNANPVSMMAALDLLKLADTYRVAILGDMFELGEDSHAMHAEVGAYAIASGVDSLLCVGENSRHMYEAAKKDEKETQSVLYFATRQELMAAIKEEKNRLLPLNSTILLKASHGMQFPMVLELLKENSESKGALF